MSFGTDHPPPPGPRAAVRWQFGVRAAAIVTGLALLAIVDVHGVAFYFAWGLIGFALVTEQPPRSSIGAAHAAAKGVDDVPNEGDRQQPAEVPKRGEAAWREHRAAIADRNERATRRARARRQEENERLLDRRREAELRERAELAKRPR